MPAIFISHLLGRVSAQFTMLPSSNSSSGICPVLFQLPICVQAARLLDVKTVSRALGAGCWCYLRLLPDVLAACCERSILSPPSVAHHWAVALEEICCDTTARRETLAAAAFRTAQLCTARSSKVSKGSSVLVFARVLARAAASHPPLAGQMHSYMANEQPSAYVIDKV